MEMKDLILGSSPAEIYKALDKVFSGEQWLTYEPETLLFKLYKDISEIAVDKVLAVQALASNAGAVFRSAVVFEKVAMAFNNNICIMDMWQPPFIEEICYAVREIAKLVHLVHGAKKEIIYIDEVPMYVASVAKERGWDVLPEPLKFAQERLDFLTGLNPDSQKYKEHATLIDAEKRLSQAITSKTASEMLKNEKAIETMENNSVASESLRRFIGAALYDPTVQYR